MAVKILSTTLFSLVFSCNLLAKDKTSKDFRGNFDQWKNKPVEKFSDAKKNFHKVQKILLKNYYGKKIDEDALYMAATKGMLAYLNQGPHQWNKLITPTEMKESQVDLTGKLTGIGVVLEFDEKTGNANVLQTLPGSPAEKAGVVAGDQVIAINGKLFKGQQFRDMIYEIRGKTGEKVRLKILRKDKIVEPVAIRGPIRWKTVHGTTIMPYKTKVAVIKINYFSQATSQLLKEELLKLGKKGFQSLVLDLRGNAGGLFDQTIQSIDLFAKKGTTVAKVKGRNNKTESIKAKIDGLFPSIPIAILVDDKTSSGAELFAASLREVRSAKILGTNTLGKWNMQTIETLPNQFSIKYTVQEFSTPGGKSWQGVGISPDIAIATKTASQKLSSVKKKDGIALDEQLLSAVELASIMI